MRLRLGSLAAALGFASLAALVSLGRLDAVDSFSVEHLMPWFTLNEHGTSLLGTLLSYHGRQFHLTLGIKLPAGSIPSSILALLLCALLWRRGVRKGALLWLAGFGLAVFVEAICKNVITRPALYTNGPGGPSHLSEFDSSFPSGHALRAALLVAIVAYVWPKARWLALAWLAAVVLTLDLDGVHTPSDILGGLLLAGVVMFAVLSLSPDAPYLASSLGRADHPSEHPDGRPRQQLPPRRAPSYEER